VEEHSTCPNGGMTKLNDEEKNDARDTMPKRCRDNEEEEGTKPTTLKTKTN